MKRIFLFAAAFAVTAHSAVALTAADLATSYQTDGYSYIQIRTGATQIKVEAVKDGQKVEVIYDAAMGTVLKTETYSVGTIVSADPGLRLREVDRDFVRLSADGTVQPGDDNHGGRGRGRDDAGGTGASSDDHGNDDHGNHDHGDDDHGDGHGGGNGGGNGGGRGRG